jgi:hypothetical protein
MMGQSIRCPVSESPPERWGAAMAGRRSLRGCLIARGVAGDKREVEMHGYATGILTMCQWPDFIF